MSLSKEWALLSKAMYGQRFIDEFARFLNWQNIKTILECGCGDGYILQGLAKRGFSGLGIDSSEEMISMALENHQHPDVNYILLDWLQLDEIKVKYDAVICRGNSLSCVNGWDNKNFKPEKAEKMIEESIRLFIEKISSGGILYVDTKSEKETEGKIIINIENINLEGAIEYDHVRKTRRVFGAGQVYGERFEGSSLGYLLEAAELEEMIRKYDMSRIWHQKLEAESNYEAMCARKM